jgi:RNA-binding protein NOB1
MKISTLVVDSAPLINSPENIFKLSDNVITVPEVMKEIVDKKTLNTLASLPFTITTKTPSQEAMNASIFN